jgi:hypothetical protein
MKDSTLVYYRPSLHGGTCSVCTDQGRKTISAPLLALPPH